MTPRKKVADMTTEEREANTVYMRKKKQESRAGKPPEKDKRGYRGAERIATQRARRKASEIKPD